MDLGLHTFDYILSDANDVRGAFNELNMPVYATLGYPHPGKLPAKMSVISIEPEEVELSAFKRAESGNGYVLRLFETTGNAREFKINIMGDEAGMAEIGAWEILTLSLQKDAGNWKISRISLTESSNIK